MGYSDLPEITRLDEREESTDKRVRITPVANWHYLEEHHRKAKRRAFWRGYLVGVLSLTGTSLLRVYYG
ncbi:MAG: hypothetical protein V3W41_14545 [Planctomycetota bacterium]